MLKHVNFLIFVQKEWSLYYNTLSPSKYTIHENKLQRSSFRYIYDMF